MLIDDMLLNGLISRAEENPRLRLHKDLRNTDRDLSQRMINALLPGTVIPIHCHRETSETTVILRGKLFMVFYDELGVQIERYLLDPTIGNYGVQIPKGQWHSVEVIAPSAILEVKDGPYTPLSPEDIID